MEPADDSQQTYQVTKGQATSILAVLVVLSAVNFGDRAVLSVALQQIKLSLGLTDTQLGLLQTVFSIAVGVSAMPIGWLIDWWSRRKAVAVMSLVWGASAFATGLATSFTGLIIARTCVGLVAQGTITGGVGWLSTAFSKAKRSIVNGLFSAGLTGGTALGLLVGGFIVAATGMWQAPFYIFAIPGVIFGIWAFFLKDYRNPHHGAGAGAGVLYWKGWLDCFKIKSYVLTVLGQTCWGFVHFTWLGWLPAFMMRAYQINAGQAGAIVGTALLVGILGSLGSGFIADAWYNKNKSGRIYFMVFLQAAFAVMTAATVFFMGSLSLSGIVALLIAQMVVIGMLGPVIFTVTMDVLPVSHRFSGHGLLSGCIFVTGAVGPSIVGAISDSVGGGADGIRAGLLWILPAAVAAVILYIINCKYYLRDSESVCDSVLAEK